jgi:ubiquinone/menaquinone biosynthesis C-methylase UbiE
MAHDDGYLLDNRQAEAGTRFDALSKLFDPSMFRHIEDLGIREGWRCWEVGVGGVSVPQWLAGRVGATGRVLATDIEVTRDEPPAETFDLVHARLVLVHLSDRDRALQLMISMLRPGGWLLIEDADPRTATAHLPRRARSRAAAGQQAAIRFPVAAGTARRRSRLRT